MIINDVVCFRDGGTKCIETDQGRYWLNKDLQVTQINKGDKITSYEVTDPREITALLHALSRAAANFYAIQRLCNQ